MSYDFGALSPTDFEELSRDLLQAEFDVRFESFAVGRDGGIDLRYAREPARHWIVQCKHFAKSGWRALYAQLKKESPKVERLKPERYVLTTSVSLTPKNKEDAVAVLHPWIRSTADIYGADDISNLLRSHPRVERAHFKLWLASVGVLERILNAATYSRTEALTTEIHRQVRLYVTKDARRNNLITA
jgi:hypothetical protein